MRAVFAAMCRMRASRPAGRRHVAQDVPAPSRSACPPTGLPAVRQIRLFACRDRMVRVVFTAGPAEGSAANLPGMRRAAPHRGPRNVLALLAAASAAAVRAGRASGRMAGRPTGLVGRVCRPCGRGVFAVAGVQHADGAGTAAHRRAIQSSAGNARPRPKERPLVGPAGQVAGGVLHRGRLGHAHQSFRATRRGSARTPHRRRPAMLRPAVASFAESLLTARARARRAGTLPRSDRTIDVALATVRDLALFLDHQRGKQDWSTVDVADIEEFLNLQPNNRPRRLTVLRQFFRFARTRRLVLIDTTRCLARKQPKGFRGRTLTIDQQRVLFRRWTTNHAVHPHEALVGILALLHGASPRELRLLRCDTIDQRECTIRLDGRPHPVPLDPASWAVLTRCLAHRQSQHTRNPHVIVTKVTKTGREPASIAYLRPESRGTGQTPASRSGLLKLATSPSMAAMNSAVISGPKPGMLIRIWLSGGSASVVLSACRVPRPRGSTLRWPGRGRRR